MAAPTAAWDPAQYLGFADDRGRPFADLLARIPVAAPRRVVDLGCGPGNLTAGLAVRWPGAVLEALDSSPEMVAAARERGVAAQLGSVAHWTPAPDTDLVVSNAVLQWVPEHRELLARWVGALAPGSWLAFQVPGNFDAPSHVAIRELAGRAEFAAELGGYLFRDGAAVDTPAGYAAALLDLGCAVDAWETTYTHQLRGDAPVLDWVSGTALTPVRARLSDAGWQRFRELLIPELARLCPARDDGRTLFGFRRVFVVAQVGSASRSASAR